MRGLLLVIEGIDGAGKTTQAERLAQALTSQGHDVVRSSEPTNGPHGTRLRQSMAQGRLEPEEELELFLADRLDHVTNLILPSLKSGKMVILDRYYFSTVAYQGVRGFEPDTLLARNEAFAPEPDLLFILDLDPGAGLTRIHQGRAAGADAFEVPELLARSRTLFLELARRKSYAHVIDALEEPDVIAANLKSKVDQLRQTPTGPGTL